MDYLHKTEPYAHQSECFELSRDEPVYALLMGMGTGKSKIIADTAAWQHSRGHIQGLVIVAPNSVHRNWLRKEIPKHLPDWIQRVATAWRSGPRVRDLKALELLYTTDLTYLRIFAISYDAVITKKGRKALERFLRTYKCLMVLDESHRIKSPDAKRTRACKTLGKKAVFKRILTGTPVTQSPLDVWAQFGFLDPEIIGWSTFSAFRAHHAEMRDRFDPLVQHIMKQRGLNRVPEMVMEDEEGKPIYKNLDELRALIAPYSYIKTTDECLDLPAKIYQRLYVQLNLEQRRAYETMLEDGVVDLRAGVLPQFVDDAPPISDKVAYARYMLGLDGTGVVKSKNGLGVRLRLTQILGGFPKDAAGEFISFERNSKLELLEEHLKEHPLEPTIIWAVFVPEIRAIEAMLRRVFPEAGVSMYYGAVGDDAREKNLIAFERRENMFFVGNAAAGGIGLDLTVSARMYYYSFDTSYDKNMQSEERPYRIGQTRHLNILHLVVQDSLDEDILADLERFKATAQEFMS